MKIRGLRAALLAAASALALATGAEAGETTRYTYDALGRLTATSSSGTVNNGVATSVAYDPAGNRSGYTVTGAADGGTPSPPPASPPPPPPPSSTPPPPPVAGNQPPVTADDRFRATQCMAATFDPLENDSDPDGDFLTITSVSGDAVQVGQMSVANNRLNWNPAPSIGNATGTYTVSDGRGGTAAGAFTVQIVPGSC